MALVIEDDEVAELVGRLATRRGVSSQEAVKLAVQAELDRKPETTSLRERLERFWAENPLPPPIGLLADKAFFDELSGDL